MRHPVYRFFDEPGNFLVRLSSICDTLEQMQNNNHTVLLVERATNVATRLQNKVKNKQSLNYHFGIFGVHSSLNITFVILPDIRTT